MIGKKSLALMFALASSTAFSLMPGCDFIAPTYAAENNEFSGSDEDAMGEGVMAMDLIDEILNAKGWSKGVNKRSNGATLFVATGTAVIAAPRNHKNYISSRQNAFDKAMLQAKKEMAEFLGASIKAGMESSYSEPGEKREQMRIDNLRREGMALEAAKVQAAAIVEDAKKVGAQKGLKSIGTAGDQAERLLRAEIDKKLIEKGFDPSKPIEQQEIKKIINSEEFSRSIDVVAQTRLAGLQAYSTVEALPNGNQGEIGVVAIQSPKLNMLADTIFSCDTSMIPRGLPKKPLKDQIPQDTDELLTSYGVQTRTDENGDLALIAYAQQGPKSNTTRSLNGAYSKAKQIALSQIRFFAGEVVATSGSTNQTETLQELEGEMSKYESDDSYQEKVKSVADSLNISGATVLKRWKAIHPLTKQTVAGVVVAWKAQAAEYAQNLHKDLNTQPRKNEDLRSGSSAGESNGLHKTLSGRHGSYINKGASPSDDDF